MKFTITLIAALAIAWIAGTTARQHQLSLPLGTTTTTWAGGRMTVASSFDLHTLSVEKRIVNIEQGPLPKVEGPIPAAYVAYTR